LKRPTLIITTKLTKMLDIVLPCYNPLPDWEKRIVDTVQTLEKRLNGVEVFLYIVNDGSSQNINPEAITYIQRQIPNFQFIAYTTNRGKGYALRQGVAATKNDICIYTDIDFPYEIESFLAIFETLKNEVDIAIGVRETEYYQHVPKVRVWISKTLKWMIRNLLRLPVSDTQCGLKGFNKKGKKVFLETTIDRYLFDLEFVFLAAKQKTLNLKPVVVDLRSGIVFSNMNFKILAQEGRSFMKIFIRSWF
jgi:glycosyltransferase involved in cell wall biosynthesis